MALSLGDPLDSTGPSLKAGDFPVGIGTYNLLGGVVLLIVGGLLVSWARSLTPGYGTRRRSCACSRSARRGVADQGIELTVETLIPEITITATGVYWHPVGAEHADQLVTRDIFPLQKAITAAIDKFTGYRVDAVSAAQWFPCA